MPNLVRLKKSEFVPCVELVGYHPRNCTLSEADYCNCCDYTKDDCDCKSS